MIEIQRFRPAESKENVHVKNALENGREDSERAGHVGSPEEVGRAGGRRGRRGRPSHQHVALPMQGKVVGAREASVTVWTLERLDASVFPEMSCQFIGPSKLPRATFPCTLVGFFSCVCPSVCFQVRTFRVHFVASLIVASVYPPLPLRVRRFHR